MKNFTTFETQLGESVELTDKAKLSLYKKSQNSGYSIDVLEEVYRRGYHCWTESFGGNADSFAFDRVNSFISGGFAEMLDEDLINEKRGLWDNIHAKRARIKAGSGERMRKPGSEGAPTDAALKASQNEDADPCWKGYKQVGMKMKGGKKVPNCVPANEDAEEHSKDFTKPSSRFIGSDELTDIYKQQTPGQIIKKVVREHLQEAVAIDTAHPTNIERPGIYGSQRAGVQRQAPRPTEYSGRASGRLAGQGGSMTGQVQTTRAAAPRAPTYSMPSGQRGSMSASPTKVSTSYSQGGVNVGKGMAASKQTSFVTRGMEKAGLEAVKKAAPAVAAGARAMTGVAGTVAGAVAPYAAKEVAKSYEKGHSQGLKPHDIGGEKYSDVASRMKEKSQGRSISSYEADVLKPQKYEQPKAAPAPKVEVDAPKAPKRPTDFTFGSAFSRAREKAEGPGGSFEYTKGSGETGIYHTGYKGETVPKKLTPVEPESGGKTLKKIKEAISEATYKGKTVPLNKPMKGDVKKSKVFVDPDGDGKAQKVNFGDKNMSIKKDQPARKRSYCARSGGQGNLTDKTSANYWSRRAWNCEETQVDEAATTTFIVKHKKSGEVKSKHDSYEEAKKVHNDIENKKSYGIFKSVKKDPVLANRTIKELSVPAGTTGKRTSVSTPMVAVRMASGKVEKHPPGKSGSSGGGDE